MIQSALQKYSQYLERQKFVQESINKAKVIVDDGIAGIERWNQSDQAEFEKWFGTRNAQDRQDVLDNLQAIRKALDGRITWDNTDWPFYDASCTPGGPVHITFSVHNFYENSMTGVPSAPGIIVHELSHEVCYTEDYVYWKGPAKKLALSDSSKAMRNADNYRLFVERAP